MGAPGPSWPGRDQEDDESYRYRIHLKLISQSGSNESAIRFDLLQVPGIQDVVFDRRAGTFYCYVYAITPIAAASVLAMVQDAIDQNVAFPLTGAALNPDQIGITLATTISTVAGSTQTDKDTATGQAIAAAQDYIGPRSISAKNRPKGPSIAIRSRCFFVTWDLSIASSRPRECGLGTCFSGMKPCQTAARRSR